MNDPRILAELGLWPRWRLRGGTATGADDVAWLDNETGGEAANSGAEADSRSAHPASVAASVAPVASSAEAGRGVPIELAVEATAARPPDSAPALPVRQAGALLLESAADAAALRLRTIESLDLAGLADHASTCVACGLCETRTNVVFGVGDPAADWLFVGEGPGANEDLQGEPFVGQAGKLLDNMLRALGMERRRHVYIANVVKCRPPGNRDPLPAEIAACEPYLKRQIALLRPKVIVALGRFAAQTLLRSDAKIGALRQREHDYQGVPVVVTYHPAYLLRTLQDKAKAWADLQLARDLHQRAVSKHTGTDA